MYKIRNLPKWLLLAAALIHLALFIFVISRSLVYPYGFDWAEGATVDDVRRVLAGQPLYAKPSLEFTSHLYAPLYTYVSALVSYLLGVGFLPLRLVSLIATAVSFWVIFLFVKRESGSVYYGLLACGLYAACYIMTGGAVNMARVDQLFLCLFLVGAFLVRFYPSRLGYFAAGVVFALSFLTKQVAMMTALPVLLYVFINDRRKSAYIIIPFAGIIIGSTLLLDHIYHGWYVYYVFKLHGGVKYDPVMYTLFFKQDLMGPLSVACVMSLFFIMTRFTDDKRTGLYYLLLAVGMVSGSWISRWNRQGFMNVVLPAYAAASMLFVLGADAALRRIRAHERGSVLVENFAMAVFALQFVMLLYNPLKDIPTKKDLDAGADFIRTMSQFKGEVYVPFHSYIPVLAGKRTYGHEMAQWEILQRDKGPIKDELTMEIKKAICDRKFDAIFIKPNIIWDGLLTEEDIKQNYDVTRVLSYEGTKYWPNEENGPELVLVRKQ
ncbi:MAG: glycosyltransferase family 39 protein [Nitrospirota bacterium]